MFNSIKDFPNQIDESFQIIDELYEKNSLRFKKDFEDIDSVLISGMGGSAIGAELVQTILLNNIKVPIVINRSTDVPGWVNKRTLVILSSYSGNTYETLESFSRVVSKTDKIISISSNSSSPLIEKSNNYKYINIIIPLNLQPRCALGYSSVIIALLLMKMDLVNNPDNINTQFRVLENNLKENLNNYCDKGLYLSKKLQNYIPIIYGTKNYSYIAALRFKNQLQENAKIFAFSNHIPEINHNEIESWRTDVKDFCIIWFKDPYSHILTNQSIDITNQFLDDLKIRQIVIDLGTDNFFLEDSLVKLYQLIHLLDWTSYYLALLNNVNPSSIDNIEHIKRSIKR